MQTKERLTREQAGREARALTKHILTSRLPKNWPKFVDYAWKNFSAKTVIELLISEEPSYFGHKDILFNGLCTWSVSPRNVDFIRRHGMLLVGIEQICHVEELGRTAQLGTNDWTSDMIMRFAGISQDFYSDFYYPIGGMRQIARSTTPKSFVTNLRKKSIGIPTVLAMMRIFDFHAKHLSNKTIYYAASLRKGTDLITSVVRSSKMPGGVSADNAYVRWKAHFETAALSYAASTIQLEEHGTLLDAILEGNASYDEHGTLLPRWLARARYSADTILAGLHEPSSSEVNRGVLPQVAPEATPEPGFTDDARMKITAAFHMESILKGRGRKQSGDGFGAGSSAETRQEVHPRT